MQSFDLSIIGITDYLSTCRDITFIKFYFEMLIVNVSKVSIALLDIDYTALNNV